jgi:hypothetical protein
LHRYDDRQNACLEADRIARECERGIEYCDEFPAAPRAAALFAFP